MIDPAILTDAYDTLHEAARRHTPFGGLTGRDLEIIRRRAADFAGVTEAEISAALAARTHAASIAFRARRGRRS